jgi:hypothetical protein
VFVGYKAEWGPRAGEEGLAAAKHDGVEINLILIEKAKAGHAGRQFWSGNFNLST